MEYAANTPVVMVKTSDIENAELRKKDTISITGVNSDRPFAVVEPPKIDSTGRTFLILGKI